MKFIARWGLMRNAYPENVQEHSLRLATIAHSLALIRNRLFDGDINPERVATLAMYYDVSEVLTGDLPAPVKYFNPHIKDAYAATRVAAKQKLLDMVPEGLLPDYKPLLFQEAGPVEAALLGAADKLSAYVKCLQEIAAGNLEFSQAEKSLRTVIASIELPEVKYFVDVFLPSFRLTLDELE